MKSKKNPKNASGTAMKSVEAGRLNLFMLGVEYGYKRCEEGDDLDASLGQALADYEKFNK